jgi:hypothetical protein
MTLEELLSYPIAGKNVVIVGIASSGKTWLSELFANPYHELVHTDGFLKLGFTGSQTIEAIFELIEDCRNRNRSMIIEGVMGYRLLLRGLEIGYRPDVIINLTISRAQQRLIYLNERDANKVKWLRGFNEMCLMSYNEYLNDCPENERPQIIEFNNNWEYATEHK